MEPISYQHIILKPLKLQELKWLLHGRDYLEKKLNLNSIPFDLSAGPEFMQEFEMALKDYIIPQVQNNEASYEWFTHWLIIDTDKHIAVGGIGFNGPPDKQGELMLGYFVNVRFEGKHFASMAAKAFCSWAFQNKDVKFIVADTMHNGWASQAVLRKCGFQIRNNTEEVIRWELRNPNVNLVG